MNWCVKWLAEHTPRCHEMTRLISQALDAPLPRGTRVKMWLHYRICAWCSRYRDQLELLAKAMRGCRHEHGPVLTDDAKDRLKRKLRGEP